MMELHEAAVFAMDAATPVALSSPDHGPRHWHDVARNGAMIHTVSVHMGGEPNRIDMEVVFLFALLHDTQRVNEYDDPDHGNRAEDLMQTMRDRGIVRLDNAQADTLGTALGDHDRGYTHKDPTIAVCWDADRLNLPRVGIRPKRTLMSSAVVRANFDACLGFAMNILNSHDLSWSEIVSLYEGKRNDPARQISA